MTTPQSERLRDYSNSVLEVLIAFLTVVPILVLIYFYPALPERIPVFLNLRGEVEVWAPKSLAAVLRVPAMAVDLQLICLLMKYGTVKSKMIAPDSRSMNAEAWVLHQRRVTFLTTRLWDWLRCLVAFKMAAASVEIIFMSDERMRFLWTPAWAITWLAAILSIIAALYYGFRLLMVKREIKNAGGSVDAETPGSTDLQKQVDKAKVTGGLIYFNPDDPAMFVDKYLFNFGNKWVYLLLASIAVYPLLVFFPL